MTTLQASGVGVAYGGLVALHDIHLTLPEGTFLAVTGPSGAGKTTLLWALAAALRPATGEVRLGDVRLTSRDQATQLGVTLIPQGNGLVTSLTGGENVLAPLIAIGYEAAEARRRADIAMDRVGLQEHGNHLIEELSGGQQQRIAIARAIACEPRVLLADEPTSDLDVTNRERIMLALRAETDRGAIVVMSTHDPEAAEHADAQLRLSAGEVAS